MEKNFTFCETQSNKISIHIKDQQNFEGNS